ncbi:MAG: response regulator transcription factor [Anaerolineae bacterium]|nr:response regulator transcription factor [Anaerolineae bacterium]
METVLIVDDDQRLLRMLQRTLVYEGYDVATASDGAEALQTVYDRRPDLVVLDWMLPGLNGLEVLEALRTEQNETPVLMLTARDAVEDRVAGLDSGADDYLIKPFAPAELVARVQALLRRTTAFQQETLSFADLYLDPVSHEARRGERRFALTPTEFELLHSLMRHPRQVLERRQILVNVWGHNFQGDDNIIEVYVGYLRKKTESDGEPRLIQTVRGVGYVLREEE